jgi:hypothetical protein
LGGKEKASPFMFKIFLMAGEREAAAQIAQGKLSLAEGVPPRQITDRQVSSPINLETDGPLWVSAGC